MDRERAQEAVKPNRREIRVFAMRRSGQHPIIFWLAKHFRGEVLFKNNVSTMSGLRRDLIVFNERSEKRDAYIFSVEDTDLRMVMDDIKYNIWKTNYGPSEKIHNLLILRDPYNLFASRIWARHGQPHHCRPIWVQHAREYAGRTSYLPNDTIRIHFNRWVRSQTYRKAIAELMGLQYTEDGIYEVKTHGLNERVRSSFQPEVTDSRKLDLFGRWKSCLEHPRHGPLYREQIKGREMHELAEEIFGDEAKAIRKELLR